MKLTLIVWRQSSPADPGRFETYQAHDVSPNMSFLEMLDYVNEDLIKAGKDPIEFDSDCRTAHHRPPRTARTESKL